MFVIKSDWYAVRQKKEKIEILGLTDSESLMGIDESSAQPAPFLLSQFCTTAARSTREFQFGFDRSAGAIISLI